MRIVTANMLKKYNKPSIKRMLAILGNQVSSDLELDTIHENLPIQTSWGRELFTKKLVECYTNPKQIKNIQLPLLVLSTESEIRNTIKKNIESIQSNIQLIDECFENKDVRIEELIHQILWKPDSVGAFFNKSPFVLNLFIAWKTIFIPASAILMPLLLLIVPFFIQKNINPEIDTQTYLEHVKSTLLKQITVPTVLKAKNTTDTIGFIIESLFIGLTLAMFISSIWNQFTAALHLRNIWFDLDIRGQAIRNLHDAVKRIVDDLRSLPRKKLKGIQHLLDKGEKALQVTKKLETLDNVATFGMVWNHPEEILPLKEWIGSMDVHIAISSMENICYPVLRTKPGYSVTNIVHPSLSKCVPNSVKSDNHIVLTGPNRGGKSTFCKTLGIAILTAQSWGFAWASKMTLCPFKCITTVLEPCGKLGSLSTFEAEIEFAKSVLKSTMVPTFVMMDEIFHSTNATDGFAASKVFLKQLYKKPGIVSVISTHYIQLSNDFKDIADPYQLESTQIHDSKLSYTYKVLPGISDKSSVMEILRERGLLESETTT